MDQHLRAVERLSRTGAADPAALLVARARAGALPPWRLELAAFLEDAAARQVVGARALDASKYLGRWVRALCRFDPEVAARVAVFAHQALAGLPLDLPPVPPRLARARPRLDRVPASFVDVVEAAEVWLDLPTAENAAWVVRLQQAYERERADAWRDDDEDSHPPCLLADVVRGRADEVAEPLLRAAVRWRAPRFGKHGRAVAERALRARLTSDLVAWALGARQAGVGAASA
ncbi:MAG: hypothetical protein KF878_31675 [Planctomycetes bacterium]|nr:hypothetical protein [Planctomycetota bacterium]